MKKIVLDIAQDPLPLNELVKKACLGIVIYKRKRLSWPSSRYAILAKLSNGRWGFVDISGHESDPTYVTFSQRLSIEKALQSSREVHQFDNIIELADFCK